MIEIITVKIIDKSPIFSFFYGYNLYIAFEYYLAEYDHLQSRA